jgi:hypothetical protein
MLVDGEFLYSSGKDALIKKWQLPEGRLKMTFQGSTADI